MPGQRPEERTEAVRKLANGWLRRARADLSVGSIVDDERLAPEIVAFHAQQAAEKALKALLVLRQVDFPRTHVIGLLVHLCEAAGLKLPESVAVEAASLTRYAVATRYPGEVLGRGISSRARAVRQAILLRLLAT